MLYRRERHEFDDARRRSFPGRISSDSRGNICTQYVGGFQKNLVHVNIFFSHVVIFVNLLRYTR